jgi:glycosyltransferase involved in cell wall biosynthesis/CMP-N-acetylneuraminic acid synthetase
MMTDGPLVTVYVPCRNYGRFLRQAVTSVGAQLYRNWQIIIIDEASDDDSATVADALRQEFPDRITVIRNERPIGLQRIANTVLRQAQGKYLMRLDADDWLDECALLLMVAKLESDPGLGLVFGNYYYTDPDGHVLGVERGFKIGAEDASGHVPPHGACTMVSTRALRAAGGYSEDVNAQDGWELWFKLSARVKTASLDAPLFYYRQHGASLSTDSQRLLTARARIFDKINNTLTGAYQPSALAVIAARESYPGFAGVPYRDISGQSLLERAILSATGAAMVTETLVSSDTAAVLAFAQKLENEGRVPPHQRLLRTHEPPPGAIPMRDIMAGAIADHSARHGAPPDMTAFLSIHAVNRRAEHVNQALQVLRITQSDSVVSVQPEREPMFAHDVLGLRLLNPGRIQDLSYARERLFRFNGAIIGLWTEVLSQPSLLGDKISYVEMSAVDSLQMKADGHVG